MSTVDHSAHRHGLWRWLGKGKTREKKNTSDDDKNPKHRQKSWLEVVRGSRVEECEKHDSCSSTTPPKIDANISYSGEEVLALSARGANYPYAWGKEREKKGWRIVKSRSTLRKDRSITRMPVTKGGKKRKFSPTCRPTLGSLEVYWICWKTGHFKN